MAAKNILTRTLKKRAETLFRENRFSEAGNLFDKICSADRTDVDARVMLGIAKIHAGEFKAAEACCIQALKLDDRHALAHHALGTALERQGRLHEAVAEFTRATELRPDFANAHFFLANALTEVGEFMTAEASYLKALQHEHNHTGAMAGLGRLYTRTGNPEAGEDWLRKALQLDPANAGIMTTLGTSLAARGRQGEALPLLQQAVSIDSDSGQAHYALGSLLSTLGQYDEAVAHYRKACALQPDDEFAFGALAGILERRGEFEQAYATLKPFIDAGATSAGIALPFADVARHFGRDCEAAAVLERVLDDPALDRKTRTDIHFRLGKLLDAVADYDNAFRHYHAANRLSHELDDRLAGHDAIDLRAEQTLQQIASLDMNFWQALLRADNDSALPLFVVGMPRSGTTLIEQILASHPDIHGAGELNGMETIAQALSVYQTGYPACLRTLTAGALNKHASRHLQQLKSLSPRAVRVVDKHPHNFMHLGLISILFPKARIIHIARDPRDTCLSIYFQIFAPQHAYSSDLTRLGRHYRTYEKLMQYWNEVLDIPILNIQYEALVADPERTVRSLIDFCGLPWDDRCMKFHETKRDVNTPSYDQVRQPLYMKSVGRWEHYRNHLKELVDALQMGES